MKQLLALSLSILISSCTTSKVYFTEKVRSDFESVGITPDKIQFYTDKQIVLQKVRNESEGLIKEGNVKTNQTIVRDKVVFGSVLKNSALGICKQYYKGILEINFEEGENRKLTFAPDNKGIYKINSSTTDWVRYDNQSYKIVSGKSAALKISKSSYTKYVVNIRRTKGLKINK